MLDPQARRWLDEGRAAGVRPPHELGVEAARAFMDEGALGLFGGEEELASIEDVALAGVPCRVYRPHELAPGTGTLVWLHGGGWVLGSLASHDPLCRALAARSTRTVISVDYRRAPEHVHPAAVEDAWAVTAAVAETTSAVAVGGDSAGGHLAANVAARAAARGLRLALQVLVVPGTDHALDTATYDAYATGFGLERASMEWFWRLYVPAAGRAADPEVSPLRSPSLRGHAPAVVLTAGCDPLRDEGERYAARLAEEGVPVELHRFDGMPHGFFRMPAVLDRSSEAIALVAGRVRDALGRTVEGSDPG
ncbi:MAG: alpha/beta hydrolase [Gaiella sp.]